MPANNNSVIKKPDPRKNAAPPDKAASPPPRAMGQKPAPVSGVAEGSRAPEKEGLLDFVIEPFSKWFDFIKKNWKGYYWGLFRITLVQVVATIGLLALFAIIACVLAIALYGINAVTSGAVFQNIAANAIMLAIACIGAIIAFVFMVWVSACIGLTRCIFTDAAANGRAFSLREAAWRIKWPALRYLIVNFAVSLALIVPVLVLFVLYIAGTGAAGATLNGGSATALAVGVGLLVAFIAIVYMVLAFLAYHILLQFWQYGFLLDNLGVVEALRRSVSIVKGRLAQVLAFDIIWAVAIIAIGIVLWIVEVVIAIPVSIATAIVEAMITLFGLALVSMLISAAVQIFMGLVRLAIGTLAEMFSVPTHYLFWKKVK